MEAEQRREEQEEAIEIDTGWENPPRLEDLKQDFSDSKPYHDEQEAKISRWLDHLNMTGEAIVRTPANRSSVQPRLIRKQAEWRYPSLSEPFLNSDDLFKINPTTWEDVKSCRQNALILNNQFNTKIDKQGFVDEFVRTVVDEGTVIVQTGWEFHEEIVTKTRPTVNLIPNPQLAPLHMELGRMKLENPTGYEFEVPEELKMAHEETMRRGGSMPLQPVITGYEEYKDTVTTANHPTLTIHDYKDVYIDPSCKGVIDHAGFVVVRFETSLSQLKKDDKYTNLENINVNNNSILGAPDEEVGDGDSNFNFRDDARKKFYAYEYWGSWDIDDSGIAKPIIATWVGDTLIRMEENPHPDKKLPFVWVSLLPKRKSPYGEPDAELLIDNQKIVGAVTRGMVDTMGKSANGQTGYRKDALDAVNRRKFEQGRDYEYNAGVDPRLAFHQHTYPEIPQSAPFMLQQQTQDAESMTGVKVWGQGITGDALGDSVGNGKSVMDSAAKRETAILRRLAAGMVRIGRKLIAMNQEFLEEEEVVRVTNDEFVTVRRDDLAGNFDMKLDISTVEEDDAKAQELAFMLQTLGPNEDPAIRRMIQADIARLRKIPELAHKLDNYEPTPDPMQQQIQQLEMQKLQLEAAEIESKIVANYASAGLDDAKAQEAIAKARQAASDADLKDLDFVEQESGVKQEREKELHGAQAQANIQLEKVKAGLQQQGDNVTELSKYLGAKSSEK